MARYKYYVVGNTVKCVSSFAKKRVTGIAKCSPEDTFDVEKGKELARLRCDLKIAKKRMDRAAEELNEAYEFMNWWFERVNKMDSYYDDAMNTYFATQNQLKQFLKEN